MAWPADTSGLVRRLGLAAWLMWATVLAFALGGWAHAEPMVTLHGSAVEVRQVWAKMQVGDKTWEREVQLPFLWDREYPGQSGEAAFELDWRRDGASTENLGLYLPRVGNAYEVWLNGHLLVGDPRGHVPETVPDHTKLPQWVMLPSTLVNTHNHVLIRIRAQAVRRGGLGSVWIGTHEQLYPVYEQAYRLQVGWALVVVAFNLTVSALTMLLWFTQVSEGRRDQVYGLAALAELCWAVRMLDPLLTQPPWPLWGVIAVCAYLLWIYCAFLFVHQVAGFHLARTSRLGLGLLLWGLACAMWALFSGHPLLWTLWLGALSCVLLCYAVWFCWHAFLQPNFERTLVVAATVINVVAGVHDWWVLQASGEIYGAGPWVRYSSVLFGWSLAIIVIRRYRHAAALARELNTTLSQRIARKEAELERTYLQQQTLLQQQERHAERARILKDMHDGVGSHLSAAIRQLESRHASRDEVLLTLRDSLDQLKLSVDGMGCEPGDITALLASLRYRLEPRLRAGGVQLIWNLDADLPVLPRMNLPAMQELRYMIFEIFSNVLQHANATTLEVVACLEDADCALHFVDNGVGFDTAVPAAHGLRYLQERAHRIGAEVSITSQPGQTRISLRLGASAAHEG